MKHIYLLILSSLLFFTASAVRKTLSINHGGFQDPTAWNPTGVPSNGDVLIVPKSYTVVVAKQVDLAPQNITMIVDGTLDLDNGKLNLGTQSAIFLSSTGRIITKQGAADQIKIGGAEKYDGKSGTIAGPALADVNTTTSIAGSSFMVPSSTTIATYDYIAGKTNSTDGITALPVNFLSFNVSQATTGISIKWATAQEENANVFQIERSEDSRTWRTVGTVKAVGNSSTIQNYSFTDKTTLNKVAYYRIKEVDNDGKLTYTEVKNVMNQSNLTSAVNNATIIASGSNVVINFSKQVAGTVIVRLISYSGQVLAQQTYNQASQQIVFNKTYVNKGNYIVSVSNNSDLNVSKQIAL